MHVLDLVSKEVGIRSKPGGGWRPIRHLRSRRIERAWWVVRYAPLRAWTAFRLWRMPASWTTPPLYQQNAMWVEDDVYGVRQRLTFSVDGKTGLAWIDIENWTEDKRDALWYGPPRQANHLLVGEGITETLREMLEYAESVLAAHSAGEA